MDDSVIAAVRTIGEALDSGNVPAVGELRSVLMTLSSYAQRREFAVDRAAAGRVALAEDAQSDADAWYQRLPISLRWRGEKGGRAARTGWPSREE